MSSEDNMKTKVIRSNGIKTSNDIRDIELELDIVPRIGEYFTCLLSLPDAHIDFYGWVNRVEFHVTQDGQSARIYIGSTRPR